MCGIFAVVGQFTDGEAETMAATATRIQGHRGPDKTAHTVETLANGWRVLLGHQRLSILDLSDAGTQPMRSLHGRQQMIFNGEIYNYLELAAGMRSPRRTGTDTEVLLELAAINGVEETLRAANGMWAIIHVDASRNAVHIARDRAGEKPLYIHRTDRRIVIASEMKTVAALVGSRFGVNRQILADYIEQGLQDVSEQTWLSGIEQLPPATLAKVAWTESGALDLDSKRYWTPNTHPTPIDRPEAEARLRELVENAVMIRLRADVPVGITLSGGLDSSILAAQMARQAGDPARVHAISSVSPGVVGDESMHIDRVCEALNINTHRVDLGVDAQENAALLPLVTWHNDAPLGSFSNVAFFRLMQLARRQGLIVSLSGQGADEIFCGYRKYFFWAMRDQLRRKRYAVALGNLAGSALSGTVLSQLNYGDAKRYLPGQTRAPSALHSQVRGMAHRRDVGLGSRTLAERQLADLEHYSVPYLTHYEDRQSMAHGVEVRLPYLDHRIIEFGLSLPTELKVSRGWTKSLMRTAFEDVLPREIIWRRDKQGFSNPQEEWLRGPLRMQLNALFRSDAAIYEYGLLDRTALLSLWERFLAGDRSIAHRQIFTAWALDTWLTAFSGYLDR